MMKLELSKRATELCDELMRTPVHQWHEKAAAALAALLPSEWDKIEGPRWHGETIKLTEELRIVRNQRDELQKEVARLQDSGVDPLDLSAEARFAMGALHRIRVAIRERRKMYAFRATDDYNNAYNDGGNNALDSIEAAIGGVE